MCAFTVVFAQRLKLNAIATAQPSTLSRRSFDLMYLLNNVVPVCLSAKRSLCIHLENSGSADQVPISRVHLSCHLVSQKRLTQLLLARLMGQYCFARCRLSSSVTLPAGGGASAERVGGLTADTTRRASTVTSRYGDTLLHRRW